MLQSYPEVIEGDLDEGGRKASVRGLGKAGQGGSAGLCAGLTRTHKHAVWRPSSFV